MLERIAKVAFKFALGILLGIAPIFSGCGAPIAQKEVVKETIVVHPKAKKHKHHKHYHRF